jgi:hypothetical protein
MVVSGHGMTAEIAMVDGSPMAAKPLVSGSGTPALSGSAQPVVGGLAAREKHATAGGFQPAGEFAGIESRH